VTFADTGAEQTYTVPDGVTSLEVDAVGANGANSRGPAPALGGTGGMVIGELAVGLDAAIKPGDTLYVAVGKTFRGDRLGGFGGGGALSGKRQRRWRREGLAHVLAFRDVLSEWRPERADAPDRRRRRWRSRWMPTTE